MCKFDHILLLGDFCSETKEEQINDDCDASDLRNIVTCFENTLNPSCIDLIVTKINVETALSSNNDSDYYEVFFLLIQKDAI